MLAFGDCLLRLVIFFFKLDLHICFCYKCEQLLEILSFRNSGKLFKKRNPSFLSLKQSYTFC